MNEFSAFVMALPFLLSIAGGLAILGGIVAFIVKRIRGKKKK